MGGKICNSNTRGENILMKFKETKIQGTFVITPEKKKDIRGYFARIFDKKEFLKFGLDLNFDQCSISHNIFKGTLRGLHYQIKPHEETKLVCCTSGRIFDVVVDLRPNSLTYRKWTYVELSEQNSKLIFIPKGCAHGFQTLEKNTNVFYQISSRHHPKSSRGIRFDDPILKIRWPLKISQISEKDLSYDYLES